MKSETGKQRILVVGDVAIIALALAHALETAGFEVIGPAPFVVKALALISSGRCDGAVLDINLRGETSEPIARELKAGLALTAPFRCANYVNVTYIYIEVTLCT